MATNVVKLPTSFKELDDSGITPFHWKIMFVSGMGFFTDAYDLFIIGVALTLLKPLWNLSAFHVAVIGSTSLIAAAAGSIVFGRVADVMGRKRIYGVEVLVLAAGAIACAFCTDIWALVVCRFILGFGIGGDYPVSATIMSEFAGTKARGLLVSMVFAMQGLGLIVGPLVALGLLASGMSHDLAWRLMLAFGAIPALSVYYMRRHIQETPRFAALTGDHDEIAAATASLSGKGGTATKSTAKAEAEKRKFFAEMAVFGRDKRLRRWLIGASLAWFLLDIAYYGNTLSSPLVIKAINAHASLVENTEITLAIFAIAAFPGYLIAAYSMDKLGRKVIQMLGFAMMAIAFAGIALLPGVGHLVVVPFVLLYGVSYFFAEFGPNTTTFVYPAEIFPARVRTTSHGITAMSGKIGAFIGTFTFPQLMAAYGLGAAMWSVGIVSVIGLLVTWAFLPEPNGKSLEEISSDDFGGSHRQQAADVA